jgi:hypothetical protein
MVVLSSEYETITGETLTTTLRVLCHDAVGNFNREYPDRYVAQAKAASIARQQALREDDEALSEEKLGNGATIGRVEIRVAGQMRHIRRKIIRGPDDDFRFVLAQRNQESGELEPVLRRGVSRVVERGSDGFWRIKSN